jgi:hypothetical protein
VTVTVYADDTSQTYENGEEVIIWYNKIGPYHNPQETYSYYSLPFCQPANKEKQIYTKDDSLGVILEGDELMDSGMIDSMIYVPSLLVCLVLLFPIFVDSFE